MFDGRGVDSMASNSDSNDEIHIPTEILIQGELRPRLEPIFNRSCCIYKVPEALKEENKYAYTPQLISIGPFHHKYPKLKKMENQKILFLSYFRQRHVGTESLRNYTKYLEDNEEKIRSCYSENFTSIKSDEFVRMMLLDAVFILELFLRCEEEELRKDDNHFYGPVLRQSIQRDLLLIENQIPFFVLEELHKHLPPAAKSSSLLKLARGYFYDYDPYPNEREKSKESFDQPKHFTDLIRLFFIPPDLVRSIYLEEPFINSATNLRLAGITFEPVSEACLLDVKFKEVSILNPLSCLFCCWKRMKPCLQIPLLWVDDSTESIFRNLIAFEQYDYPYDTYISSYIVLIANLIQTKEDVDLFVEKEVIINALTNEDLLQMMKSLVKHVVLTSYCYGELSRKVNKHYYNPWNRGLAIIRLVYFKDASRTAATISGLIVLVFSIVSLFSALKDLNVKILS